MIPSSLPSCITTSAPIRFSAICSMASYTLESGEMDQTAEPFICNKDLTGSSRWMAGSVELLVASIAALLLAYSEPSEFLRQGPSREPQLTAERRRNVP